MDEKICRICLQSFTRKKHSNENQKYCLKKCSKKAYYYSPKGQIQRKNALKRVMLRYNTDPNFKKRWNIRTHRYRISTKGRETKSINRKKYRNTTEGKLSDLKYARSSKRKASLYTYTQSFKGKLNSLRASLKRREAMGSIMHTFTLDQWVNKLKQAHGICKKCKNHRDLTLDHIYPVSKAQKDYEKTNIKRIYTINDVEPLCLRCNISKNDRINEVCT